MPSETLSVGTPLWRKPTIKAATSADLNTNTRAIHPEETDLETTFFCGVTMREGQPVSGQIPVSNQGNVFCRVIGPVAAFDAVGFSQGNDYLAKDGVPSVGLCRQSVGDGLVKLVEISVGASSPSSASGAEMRKVRVKAEGADFLICLEADGSQVVVAKPGHLQLFSVFPSNHVRFTDRSSSTLEISPGTKVAALQSLGYPDMFQPFTRARLSSGEKWMEGAIKSVDWELFQHPTITVEVGGLHEGVGTFSDWSVEITTPQWIGYLNGWPGSFGTTHFPYSQSSLDDSTLDGYEPGWFKEGFLWRRGINYLPFHTDDYLSYYFLGVPFEYVFADRFWPRSQKLCIYPSYLHTESVNYTAGPFPQDGVLASATCKFGAAEQGVAFAEATEGYPLKEIVIAKMFAGHYHPPSLAISPFGDTRPAVYCDLIDLNIDGREWKTLAEVKMSQVTILGLGEPGYPVDAGLVGNE